MMYTNGKQTRGHVPGLLRRYDLALLKLVEKAWARATIGEGTIRIRYVVSPAALAGYRCTLFERFDRRATSQSIKLPCAEMAPGPDAATLKVE